MVVGWYTKIASPPANVHLPACLLCLSGCVVVQAYLRAVLTALPKPKVDMTEPVTDEDDAVFCVMPCITTTSRSATT